MKASTKKTAIQRLTQVIAKSQTEFEEHASYWQRIAFEKYDAAIPLDSWLSALEVRDARLNIMALEGLSQKLEEDYTRQPLTSESILAPLGKLQMPRTQVKKRLKQQGIRYQPRVDANCTHLLIGQRLQKEELWYLLEQRPANLLLLTEKMLIDTWCKQKELYLMHPEASAAQITQLKTLLWHQDPVNIALALQMLEAGGVPESLMTSLFLVYKFSTQPELIKQSNRLLKIYGSGHLQILLKQLKQQWWATNYELWMKQAGLNYWEVYQYEYLSQGLKADLFQKALDSTPEAGQVPFIKKAMEAWTWGEGLERMQLPPDFNWEKYATLIYDCTQLKQLTINPAYQHRLLALPKGIERLQQLEDLRINTALQEFPKVLSRLPQLKHLKINMASMNIDSVDFSEGFEALESLTLSFYRYKQLPESIGALAQLRSLRVPAGDLEQLPNTLRQLQQLEELYLNNNKFRKVPDLLYLLAQLKVLDVSGYWMRWQGAELETLRRALPHCKIII